MERWFSELLKGKIQLNEASDALHENIRKLLKDYEDQMENMTTENDDNMTQNHTVIKLFKY